MSSLSLTRLPAPTKNYAGSQHKAEVVPGPVVIDSVDGNVVLKKTAEKRKGSDKAMPESVPETIGFGFKTFVNFFNTGATG